LTGPLFSGHQHKRVFSHRS